MNAKIAFKSDGTVETGTKIINALKGLGGNDIYLLDGMAKGAYYFITPNGNIDYYSIIPDGYHLNIDEPNPEPTFPRQMWCWDGIEDEGREEEVLGIFPNRKSQYKVIGTNTHWKNAIELPTQNPDSNEIINKMQETIDDLLIQIKELKTITNK